jgi:2',3'-cyclic-nucleotide 2'-phosphodiesterase (5'-nucleotidase family)
VKAERAKAAQMGGHVLFAHAGDTLSPSLLSGIDRGYHIMALLNMIPPDIFVPGNHEFDFGKEVFLQRMKEAKFPLFAANMRDAKGAPMPGFKDRTVLDVGGIKVGLTGAALTETPQVADSGDVKFSALVPSMQEQCKALRAEGADFVVTVVHAPRDQDMALFNSRAADLILSGHDHDLFIDYDGPTGIVESSHDGHYVTVIELTIQLDTREGRRITWFPNIRPIDTADIEPDPEVLAAVRGFENELSKEFDVAVATTGRHPRQPHRDHAHRRSGDRQSLCRRHPRDHGIRDRHHQWRRFARREGLSARQRDYPPRRAPGIAVPQSCRGAGDFRERRACGDRERRQPAAPHRRALSACVRPAL